MLATNHLSPRKCHVLSFPRGKYLSASGEMASRARIPHSDRGLAKTQPALEMKRGKGPECFFALNCCKKDKLLWYCTALLIKGGAVAWAQLEQLAMRIA